MTFTQVGQIATQSEALEGLDFVYIKADRDRDCAITLMRTEGDKVCTLKNLTDFAFAARLVLAHSNLANQ